MFVYKAFTSMVTKNEFSRTLKLFGLQNHWYHQYMMEFYLLEVEGGGEQSAKFQKCES